MSMKKTLTIIAGVVAVGALGFVGFKTWHNASQSGDDRLMRELGLTKQFAAPRAPKQVPVLDAMNGHQSQVVLAE